MWLRKSKIAAVCMLIIISTQEICALDWNWFKKNIVGSTGYRDNIISDEKGNFKTVRVYPSEREEEERARGIFYSLCGLGVISVIAIYRSVK